MKKVKFIEGFENLTEDDFNAMVEELEEECGYDLSQHNVDNYEDVLGVVLMHQELMGVCN